MAVNTVGDARKRSNTGGSSDDLYEDRIVLLSAEDPSNLNTESEMSDDNHEDSGSLKLIKPAHAFPESVGDYTRKERLNRLHGRYCTHKFKKLWMGIFVGILFVVLIAMVAIPLQLESEIPQKSCADLIDAKEFAPYIFEPSTGQFALCHDKEPLVTASLGTNHHYLKQPTVNTYEYQIDSTLYLSRHSVVQDHCVRVEWEGTVTDANPLNDCFDMADGDWFGGYESQYQRWPINGDSRGRTPFVSRDYFSETDSPDFGPILHPVWASSKGVVIFVDPEVPLHVSVYQPVNQSHDGRICLQALPHSLNCIPGVSSTALLHYTVCGFHNVSRAVQFFLSESGSISNTSGIAPSASLLERPIWSTVYGNLTQDNLVEFASNITSNNYPISRLEINDRGSSDLLFSEERFPDIDKMLTDLHSLGINDISSTVYPFINYQSNTFSNAVTNDRFFPGYSHVQGNDVVLIKWWNGNGAVINYLDNITREWHSEQLRDFMSTNGLASLKFDGGSDTYLPKCVYSDNVTSSLQYTRQYVKFVASQQYTSTAVISVGYFSQGSPLLFRLLDRDTLSWGLNNGLHSILTSTLSLGMAGYPFVFSDTSAQGMDVELYVRWMQLTAFLPILQVSYPPWNFNQTVVDHVKGLLRIHKEVYNNYTKAIIHDATTLNHPIVRPLWWLGNTFINNNDQFLIGDNFLVAPILYPSSDSSDRIVVIPSGTWRCISVYCSVLSYPQFDGPTTHTFTSLSLFDLLYFVRL